MTSVPLFAGILAFVVVVGSRALDPANIAWLGNGDSATHYLGWQFFRAAPWSVPPGANPAYGLELSSSIVYSDSIPGLALIFKLFEGLLPATFQYFGLWLLACFLLQAVLGWKLMALMSERAAVRILGCGLILFAPAFLWRVGVQSALAAHWLILGALYLNLREGTGGRILWWSLVLCAAILVHAYLFFMVLALWLADFIVQIRQGRGLKASLLEALLLASLALVCMWLCGYFLLRPGSVVTLPFGAFRMNLLSPVDASGWSHVLPDIPEGPHDYDGFNFLGLGIILLGVLVFSRIGSAARAMPRRYLPLLAVLIALALLAISHKVAIAETDPLIIPLPGAVLDALSILQSSGRFFWPVYYALVCLIVWLVVRSFRHEVAVGLLGLALVVQIVDTSAGWRAKREPMNVRGSEWQTSLNAPFWNTAAEKYKNVRWVPATNYSSHWKELAYYASKHRMGTDAIYLARVDSTKLAASRRRAAEAARTGGFDQDSLYVFDPRYASAAAWNLRPGDYLAEVDGLTVLAPGWGASTIPRDGSESRQRP